MQILRLRRFLYDNNLNGTGGDYFHTFCHISCIYVYDKQGEADHYKRG